VESTQTLALTRLTDRRFRSFSEAVDSVLGALEQAIPGTVMLGQLDPAEQLCRVLEVRGVGNSLRRGMSLPLAPVTADTDTPSTGDDVSDTPVDGKLDQQFLRSLSVKASLARPLEMSDGSIIGTLCALDTEADSYRVPHLVMLGVAARLLSYEWENVSRRAELRRLRERVRDVQSSDADTGLPNRDRFLDMLEREWRLTARGSVHSILVVCQVNVDAAQDGVASTMATLALKDAAEVLSGTARSTDHVGRTGAMDLAVILVGCHGLEGAQAFLRRFREGVKRVTRGRAVPISVSCSMLPLADTHSAREALELAGRITRERSPADAPSRSSLGTGGKHE
jgi:GGDEF domain-containing protein